MENDTNKDASKEHTPKKRSKPNICSYLFLCWMCPVFLKGNRRPVEEKDLIVPPSKIYDSEVSGDLLEKNWLIEYDKATRNGKAPSLTKTLVKTYWLSFVPGGLFVVVKAIVAIIRPLVFARLLTYWSVDSEMTTTEAGYYALGLISINAVTAMTQHHYNMFTRRFSLKIKVACSALIYRKLLRVNQASIGDVAAGKLVNLLAGDMARFDLAFIFLNDLWVTPILVGVVLYLMWDMAGYAPFVGIFSVTLMMVPLQGFLTKLSATYRRLMAARTDQRIKLMSEIINGIQVIKMYAWEKPFQTVVAAARAYEVAVLKKSSYVRSIFIGFSVFTQEIITLLTCVFLLISGQMVTATLIFPLQQYFSIIQVDLIIIFPMAIMSLAELLVSIERIQAFLVMDEREDLALLPKTNLARNLKFNDKQMEKGNKTLVANKYSSASNELQNSLPSPKEDTSSTYAIEVNGVSASWTNSEEKTLKNVTLRVRRGKSCAIIGPVGSGKSSLLQVLLKELPVCGGHVNVHGKVSYACQEPWLFPATVRENILFGQTYDAKKYKEVARACCLLPDFKQFPYGDLSLVGERGVTLSGGQKARINLARAVYREADVYLLDDPLSAVDANVGRLLFEGCINGYLRGKTVVLVTHQVHFVQACDTIVLLNQGAVDYVGSYDELIKSGNDYTIMLTNVQETKDDKETEEKVQKRTSLQRGISTRSDNIEEDQKEELQAVEERATGTLNWSVLSGYLKAVDSWCIVMSVLIALILTQGVALVSSYWLSIWTNNVDGYLQENNEEPDPSDWHLQVGLLTTAQYVIVYASLILGIIAFLLIRIYIYVVATVRASKNLHNLVFKNLIRSVMRFFDTSSSGRILNRFAKDLGAVDEQLPRAFIEMIQYYFSMISILIVNALALPYTLIPTAVLMILFYFLVKWYLNAAQSVKRLEGTTKSPVFGKISSTIAGISTIRSFNASRNLLRDFDNAQDTHSSAFYTYIGGTSAFGLYLDWMCLTYLAIILAIFILLDFGSLISVGSVGLAVSQTMVMTQLLQIAAKSTSEFLAQSTSVERVLEYSNLPAEQNVDEGPTKPPKGWPSKGHIKFQGVYLKYGKDDAPVLKNLCFEVQSGWKVGVVGRTGAGKSSLISALFRLYDIEGSVEIDGLDTFGISKQELRSKISIIPQEPVLFSASLRYNLDPFNMYSDDDIWRALEQVELKDAIPALDFKVSEGGSNFSVGQRQLVCLARAILRSNKILIMDEATANVDPQTDALIQETIRKAFASCTVLTIAHRLNTIMDSDRVLVMDKGEAVELDTPYALLCNPNSVFTFMVKETGDNMSKKLFEIAKEKYFSENTQETQDDPEKKTN
ncbi:ABC transporter domain-containing protein [Phthorimaea operculella]|nr:ABC transporter domain-containing protein [Phthorimaea operculella]